MRLILLAAGYGTRLGELAEDRPKALLPVAGRPLLDHLVDRLSPLPGVATAHLVTNHRFVRAFREWRAAAELPWSLAIVDDGTTRPEDRLGAVGDLRLVLERTGTDRQALVAGTDTLPGFSLEGLVERGRRDPGAAAIVTVVEEEDPDRLRRSGVPELAKDGRVERLHEKPPEPPNRLAAVPFYLFRPRALEAVRTYLDAGGEPDAPGHFLEWLVERARVIAWRAPGSRWDVGTPGAYRRAREAFEGGGV